MLVELNHKTAINLSTAPVIDVKPSPAGIVPAGGPPGMKPKPYQLDIGSGSVPIHMTKAERDTLYRKIEEYTKQGGRYFWLVEGRLAINLDRVTSVHAFEQSLCVAYAGGRHMINDSPRPADYVARYVREMEQTAPAADFAAAAAPANDTQKKFRELLAAHTVDLTAQAQGGELDKAVGRDAELKRVMRILGHKVKNNVMLVGDAGVGKTTLVHGLAQKIVENADDLPGHLRGRKVVSISLSGMDTTNFKGEVEGKLFPLLDGFIDEARAGREYILFIDEGHAQMRAGASASSPPAAEHLKPYLTNPCLRFMTATTLDEYQKYIARNKALDRRFSSVLVSEPAREQAIEMVEQKRTEFQRHYALFIPPALVPYVYDASQSLLLNQTQPDKSISLLDDAASVADGLKEETVEEKHVLTALEHACGLRSGFLSEDQAEKYRTLEQRLSRDIHGQDDALRAVAEIVKSGKAGLSDESRPIASLLLMGNAKGLGRKTAARALADHLAGGSENAVCLDLAPFSNDFYGARHRLLGLHSHRPEECEEGALTGFVTRKPYAVVIFENIDKAHPEVQDFVAAMSRQGEAQDAAGKRISFRNTIFIATSSSFQGLGADILQSFRPVKFDPLPKDACVRILKDETARLSETVERKYGVALDVPPRFIDGIANENAKGQKGARDLLNQFRREIADPLGSWLVDNMSLKDAFGAAANLAKKGQLVRVLTVSGVGASFDADTAAPPSKPPPSATPEGNVVRLAARRGLG